MISLDKIRIVMINTSDSGNIGAAARALKTMGLARLYLVDPLEYPTGKATARASGAADVLHNATVVSSLNEAIEGCSLVWGTSARMRSIPWPVVTPRQAAEQVANEHDETEVAIIFGRENSGMTNDELRKCHYHISIPSNDEYGVLNVASAIQLICYEMRVRLLEPELEKNVETVRQQAVESGEQSEPQMPLSVTKWDSPLVNIEDMERFFLHFEQTLLDIDFFDPNTPRQLMTRARRLFNRTRLDRLEMNLMRGFFSKVQKLAKVQSLDRVQEVDAEARVDSSASESSEEEVDQ
jgi:tRNA (cytidine32/uridine32-2'-O)-methyltransferase